MAGVVTDRPPSTRAQIVAALVAGEPQRSIAMRFEVGTKYITKVAASAREAGVLVAYKLAAPTTYQAAALRKKGLDVPEIAAKLGKDADSIRKLLARLDARDTHADDVIDTTPGCGKCGLRGDHECLPDRAEAYLGRRDAPSCVRHRSTG